VAEPFLTEIELVSAVWKKLRFRYEARLEMLRKQLEGDKTPEQTTKLRGRIAEINALLSLGTGKPQSPDDSMFE
jgi:hypothetical protein